jgi:hypothetical protein
MDYNEWGMEYLREARQLKEHISPLRREVKTANSETASKINRRIAALNEMYLDCLHTGKFLIECGGSR